MSVVLIVVAFVAALLCYRGSRVLGRKAAEAGQEATSLRLQNQQTALQFAQVGGVEALQGQLGFEEKILVANVMVAEGRHPYEEGHVIRRLFGPDFESTDQQAKAASASASRYSVYTSLCKAGAWVAGATAFVAVIYPFLS